jgi:SAM-dependent methyltransferase
MPIFARDGENDLRAGEETMPVTDTPREKLRQGWDERYATFSLDESGCRGAGIRLNQLIYRAKKQALRKALRIAGVGRQSPIRVLDMGCGFGYFAGFYHEEFPRASYVGVDISARAIGHARETMPQHEFFAHDVVSWRHPANARFDVVQAIDVLQLLIDDAAFDQAVENLALHLDDGGTLLLPLMFSDRPPRAAHQRVRSRAYFDTLIGRLGLTVTHELRMYYWLIDGGSQNRVLRAMFAITGPFALYLVDRLALMMGLEHRDPDHVLSGERMLIIRRAASPHATGPRSTTSEN